MLVEYALKPAEAESSFRKVSLPPANLDMLSLLTSRLESIGHKSTPSRRSSTEAYYSRIP